MKFAVVLLLGLSLLGACEAGQCAEHCNEVLDDCACDNLCPLFGDCCDAETIMADCNIDPSSTTGELDLSDEIFAEGEFKMQLGCGSNNQNQELSNEGSDIWRMYFTAEDSNTDRVTVNVCDHHDSLMVSVMKPMENGDVQDQCGLIRCECTFQPSGPGYFYIVAYRLEILDDDADTDLSTDYDISVTCAAEDADACMDSLEAVKDACPTNMEDSNTCFDFEVAADCCANFVDYFDQCGETVSEDAGLSTACLAYPGDAATARRCSAEEVVVFDTTLGGLGLGDITDNFLTAFRKAMAATLGIDVESVLVSGVEEVPAKSGGVKIGITIIADTDTTTTSGDSIDAAGLSEAVTSLDTEALAANTNQELQAEGISTTTSADSFAVSEPVVEEAVATPSNTPSASPSPSASLTPSSSAAMTPSPSSSAATTPSSTPSSTPSPETCVTLEENVNGACLTDGCVNTDIAVGSDCCSAVTAYTAAECTGYSFDESCNTNPASLLALFSDNCESSTTSGASAPTMLAAAVLALLAFAVRA